MHLLIQKVAASNAALGQILAVKLYENLTYCHSVNVATLSLLIGRQLGFDQAATSALAEAALLHDIGKTRIPLEILKKPSALDKRERRMMEAHTTHGAEILVDVDGLRPLTPTVALEHHRGVDGTRLPGARGRRFRTSSARLSPWRTSTRRLRARARIRNPLCPSRRVSCSRGSLGRSSIRRWSRRSSTPISFFPLGSVVRTDRDEIGVVVRTISGEPLHPVIALMGAERERLPGDIDTSRRLLSGQYERHVVETLRPMEGLDLTTFLATA